MSRVGATEEEDAAAGAMEEEEEEEEEVLKCTCFDNPGHYQSP